MADMKIIQARRRRNAMIREVTGMTTGGNRQTEHQIQVRCIRWLKYAMPTLYEVTFAVPNGGVRDELTVKKLKEEGQKNGVADLIMLKKTPEWGALCIEMKTPDGRQSKAQKEWQMACELIGSAKYVVPRSLEDFKREVLDYAGTIVPEEKTLEADRRILLEYAEAMKKEKGEWKR